MACERILVVDEDQDSARNIGQQLTRMGYTVASIADNGPEAISKAGSCAPDLLLISIQLGRDMDGIDTARIIMQQHQVPVIYLSARTDAETLARAMDTHPLGYMNKPVREADLHSTISLALSRRTTAALPVLPPDENGTLWQTKITCNTEGKITRTPQEAKQKLKELGLNHIQELLPETHAEHIRACYRNRNTQLVFSVHTGHLLSLEYLPAVYGVINVLVSGRPLSNTAAAREQISLVELQDTLDHLTAGTILFNENLNIFYANKSARKLLDAADCIEDFHGYLICRDPEVTAELKAIAVDQKDHLLAIDRGAERAPLNVMVTTLNTCRTNIGKNLPTSILFAFEITDNSARIEEVLRSLYRLSPSESRLVSQLFLTPHLPTVAENLGITLNTARTHLKRIYAKTRVNRIASLIHMIATGPASVILNTDS
jgi:DNA-binding NarL/FixJ family response regulator